MESLQRLKALHADLVAHAQQSLSDIDRLWHELHESIADFRALLNSTEVSPQEAQQYKKGEVEVDGTVYQVNDEFRHLSNAIGTVLGVSEEYAGRLVIETQATEEDNYQNTVNSVVRAYHDRHDYLLQDLRMVLEQSTELEAGTDVQNRYKEVIEEVVESEKKNHSFANNCIAAMLQIETRQMQLTTDLDSRKILGQARGQEFYNTLEFQRSSLFKQHEALGAILAWLFKTSRSRMEDARKLQEVSKKWQRMDLHWIHYLPAFGAAFDIYGSQDGNNNANEARELNHIFAPTVKNGKVADDLQGPYRPLAATLEMWWVSRYSSFYRDNAAPDSSMKDRDQIMKRCIEDGGLDFMLSICTYMRKDPWRPTARQELVYMLLDGSNITFEGTEQSSLYFVVMMMEAFENFSESWITNMPDSIRNLKKDEDSQRLKQLTANVDNVLQPSPREQGVRLHLEVFLVVIAFAFEGRSDEAEQFWNDRDSNLYGFIQWASRRQTVPRVGAFCEMLCAISELSANAQSAHKFLLEDTISLSTMRNEKLPSMSYQQIFAELEFYSRKVHEKAQVSQIPKTRRSNDPELNELESPLMLSCYLRLLSHLCRQTELARDFVLNLTSINLPKSLLNLCSGSIPTYLRANIFSFFEALLTDKTAEVTDRIWTALDEWASLPHDRMHAPADKQPTPSLSDLQNTLGAVSSSFEQNDAFVRLLVALVEPLPEDGSLPLPFPADLGIKYRYPGITPYIDMVCSQFTTQAIVRWQEDDSPSGTMRIINTLELVLACLASFNEKAIVALDKNSQIPVNQDYYASYVQRHPFARVMQWLFSSSMMGTLTNLMHQPIESIQQYQPGDPKLFNLSKLLELCSSISELQATYFDILRPKLKVVEGYRSIQSSGLTAIEDAVISQSELLLDLCQYAASEHADVSLRALDYLQRLSESPKFQHHMYDETRMTAKTPKMIELIGPIGEISLQHISRHLSNQFAIEPRELEAGIESDDFKIKDGVLSFLKACLSMHVDGPNLAHLLLGFERLGSRLEVTSAFDAGNSMFDAVAGLTVGLPFGLQSDYEGWLMHLKAQSFEVLRNCWTHDVSSSLATKQLRRVDLLVSHFIETIPITYNTIWDGEVIFNPDFYFTIAAESLTEFLTFRSTLYDYISNEIKAVDKARIIAVQEKYVSTLQGKSKDSDGNQQTHASVFDLFDFAELDFQADEYLSIAQLRFFAQFNFDDYMRNGLYDMDQLHILVNEVTREIAQPENASTQIPGSDAINEEATYVLQLMQARNRHVIAKAERLACLHSYASMVVSIINSLPMDMGVKTHFILRMLQLILPKLDTFLADGAAEAIELTQMADTLLVALFETEQSTVAQGNSSTQSKTDTTIAEKLFQLFRICTEGVAVSATNPDLRGSLYSICAQYLTRLLSSESPEQSKARINAMDTVRSAGPQLITILSDDADDGLDACRLNALNFLSQLVNLSRDNKSTLMIEAFTKSNILEVLLDPIKTISQEFSRTEPSSKFTNNARFMY